MTSLDENVNRVPRQQHKTAENMGELANIFYQFSLIL